MKKILVALSFLVGLALFAFVIIRLGGIKDARETLAQIGWLAVLVYFANATLTLVVPAISWTILMRGEGLRVSYWTALKANFMGGVLNFVTPSLYLGGEPLKTFYVASVLKQPKRRVLATIIVAKFQEFGAHLLVMIVAVGIAVWRIDFTRRQETLLISSMAVLLTLFGLTLYAFIGNFKPTVKIIGLLARLGLARRRMARLRSRARDMEQLIHNAFTKRWKTFLASQFIVLFSAGSIFMRTWIFFAFAGVMLGSEKLCAVYVITNIANSLPIPGGLGVYEGGMALFAGLVGLPEEGLATFLIVNRVADIILFLIGLYFIVHLGLQSVARSVAKGEVKASLKDAGTDEAVMNGEIGKAVRLGGSVLEEKDPAADGPQSSESRDRPDQ